jgi:hypothetical protein
MSPGEFLRVKNKAISQLQDLLQRQQQSGYTKRSARQRLFSRALP